MAKHTRHASELTKARKRSKKLRREAQTRIRKARKQALDSEDEIALENIEKIAKKFARALMPTSKEKGLSNRMKSNVNREIGKELTLERLNKRQALNQKKQKRVANQTFKKIYGDKAKGMIMDLGQREVNKRSNEFWHAMYEAQDLLASAGFVPIEEIYGRNGSIGSGLLEVGTSLIDNGYWADFSIEYKPDNSAWVVMSEDGIDEMSLPQAILKYYEQEYDM